MQALEKQPTTPVFNSIRNAAARLGIGVTMLYSIIGSGQLRTVKLGARTLIHESELQRFAAERMESNA